MEDYQSGFQTWVKAHTKQLLIAGISISVIVGIMLSLKNKDTIMKLRAQLEKSIKKVPDIVASEATDGQVIVPATDAVIYSRSYTAPKESFDVCQHIRTLSGGRQHSAEKAAEAATLGIILLPNQTIVDSYTKCVA